MQRAVIVGGSLAGLMTAVALTDAGVEAEVFDRSHATLEDRGAGLRLQPNLTGWLQSRGIDLLPLTTFSQKMRHLGPGNEILFEEDQPGHSSSWGTLYRGLLEMASGVPIHMGELCTGFEEDADGVSVQFASGSEAQADLVVFCDGIASTGRTILAPEARREYAGYIGWRGYVPEGNLSKQTLAVFDDATVFNFSEGSHVGFYAIPGPGGDVRPGHRLINYVWYRNLPAGPEFDALITTRDGVSSPISLHAGQLKEEFIAESREAAAKLPPAAAEVITKTEHPFIQPIYDVYVPRMARGRACLLGDAAFVARPHAGGATSKAAADALRLAEEVVAGPDIPSALTRWEAQQMPLGRALVDKARDIGRRYQGEVAWTAGDPSLRLGLPSTGKPASQ
ncbi:MAG: 2,6-dihydroxypyridine 3-monooxygenase [Gaiellales bacterium]|nr:2,6-dihydroxypyridine 3-monooxygenase [Gaiellales bacterium]